MLRRFFLAAMFKGGSDPAVEWNRAANDYIYAANSRTNNIVTSQTINVKEVEAYKRLKEATKVFFRAADSFYGV